MLTMYQLYSQYVRKYENAERQVKKDGAEGMYSTKLSREEFEVMYEAEMNTQLDSPSSIVDKIVKDQRYAISDKQAVAFQKAMKTTFGKEMTLKEIYNEAEWVKGELMASAELMNEDLKNMGLESGSERSLLISQAIFGSP